MDREAFLGRLANAPSAIVERLAAAWWLRDCNEVGANARCAFKPDINNRGTISVGSGARIRSAFVPTAITCHEGAEIRIGKKVWINYGVMLHARRSVRIANNVWIGELAIISDTCFPGVLGQAPAVGDEAAPIEIGENVWIAARVTVLPGTTIGAGAVIGAGSIVGGRIPPGVIAMGIPARPVVLARSREELEPS